MATIGTFTASNNGFTGSVKTLTLNVKATFVATEKENDSVRFRMAARVGAALTEARGDPSAISSWSTRSVRND